MKPRIGVSPLFFQQNENLWINHLYFDGVTAAGGVPFLLPLLDDEKDLEAICQGFDGFIFTGGQDIDPALYGEEKIPECSYQAPKRDIQELWMLKRLLQLDKPVLGICRGVQMMTVALGGSLYQDLPVQFGAQVDHAQMEKAAFDQPFHEVALEKGTKLYSAVGKGRIAVNSMHHQGVKAVPDSLLVTARSDDGLAEAVEHKTSRFYLGVQWHPEFLWEKHPHALNTFRLLTEAAKRG